MAACSNDMERVAFFAPQEIPSQQVDSATVVRSSEGNVEMIMTAPHIDVYKMPEPKTVCPKGVEVRFFSSPGKVRTLVRADYGISYDQREVVELKKNVVIIDFTTGDTSYLEDLHWNGIEHRVYSHHPVRSVNGQRVTIGDSFESDENFEQPLILHQRGTLLIEED